MRPTLSNEQPLRRENGLSGELDEGNYFIRNLGDFSATQNGRAPLRERDRRIDYCPVPYSVAFCRPVPALSLAFNVPVYVIVVAGEKLTATVHDAPGASVIA